VLQSRVPVGFGTGSGLDDAQSDWLLAAQLTGWHGLNLTNRALFDDALTFTRNELRVNWTAERGHVGASYLYQEAAPAEDRPTDTHELLLDGSWQVTDRWAGSVDGRYDFSADRAASAGLGVQYATECVTVDLSLSRRFTSSTSVRPTTDFGLSVALNGFGNTARARGTRRACTR